MRTMDVFRQLVTSTGKALPNSQGEVLKKRVVILSPPGSNTASCQEEACLDFWPPFRIQPKAWFTMPLISQQKFN